MPSRANVSGTLALSSRCKSEEPARGVSCPVPFASLHAHTNRNTDVFHTANHTLNLSGEEAVAAKVAIGEVAREI